MFKTGYFRHFIVKGAVLGVFLIAASVFISSATASFAADKKSDISIKAGLSSLAEAGDADELLEKYDGIQGNIADPDGEYEKILANSTYKTNGFSKKELKYMSAIIFCEANSMSHDAMVAVANVILNRMRDKREFKWGHVNTIYDVIYDRKWGVQFSPTAGNPPAMERALKLYSSMNPEVDKDWEIRAMTNCIAAAKAALAGYKSVPDNFYSFNGHLESQREKNQKNGYSFAIMDGHIYYTSEKDEY